MGVVGVLAAYSARGACVWFTAQERTTHPHHGQNNIDYVYVNGHDIIILVILAKHCLRLPDDGSTVIRNML